MAISNTKIANLALIEIGVKRIDSISDESERAGIMNDLFDQARDAMLEGYQWNFAMKRAALTSKTITTEQALEFTNAWNVPNDPYSLRVTEIIESDEFFKVEGRTLLTNLTSGVSVKYIARIEDPVQFTPSFIEALVAILASKAAGSAIKKDAELKATFFAIHEELLLKAKGNDGQEGTAADFSSSELTDVRFQVGGI